MKLVINLWTWLWCTGDRERAVIDATDKLQMSMRVTAKSRYNAAGRLQSQSRFSFVTTTILSLGLIFIPLMQNAGVTLAFASSVLNMIQIFLAVSVLVYSVIIATARFDVRAEKLTECGDRLKELIRAIDRDRCVGSTFPATLLTEYQKRYSDVVGDCENHTRSDYHLATLEMRRDYFLTGLPRFITWLRARLSDSVSYSLPSLMLCFELAFITDMIGVSHFFAPFLSAR